MRAEKERVAAKAEGERAAATTAAMKVAAARAAAARATAAVEMEVAAHRHGLC